MIKINALASNLYPFTHKKFTSQDYARLGRILNTYDESYIFDALNYLLDNLDSSKKHPNIISLFQWKLSTLVNKQESKDLLNINMGL